MNDNIKNSIKLFADYEKAFDWEQAISIFNRIYSEIDYHTKLNLTNRLLFLISDSLIELQNTEEQYNKGSEFLLELSQKARIQFKEEADFWFCLGICGISAYFLLEMKSDDEVDEIFKSVYEKMPENLLYKAWYFCDSVAKYNYDNSFKREILKEAFSNNTLPQWEKDNGLIGFYVVEFLRDVKKELDDALLTGDRDIVIRYIGQN